MQLELQRPVLPLKLRGVEAKGLMRPVNPNSRCVSTGRYQARFRDCRACCVGCNSHAQDHEVVWRCWVCRASKALRL